MKLSEKIAIIRKARKYSQEDLGDKIGVSRQTISFWENGDYEPTLDNIRALAQVLDVSFDTLLDDSVYLDDEHSLNRALKHLDEATKNKINNSFRYRIREYTVKKKDYVHVIIYFSVLLLLTVSVIVNAFYVKDFNINFIIECVLGSSFLFTICIMSIPIALIKRISAGGIHHSFGTLSQTHFVIIGWSDAKFDRTVYIPVTEIESMELAKDATARHGRVIVKVKDRNKPVVTNDIVEPQKLIDIFNNLETFIDNPYGK